MKRLTGALLLWLYALASLAQIADSVVLQEVTILDRRLFDKENAGSKETHVDSVILSEHQNHTLSEVLAQTTPIFIKSYGRGSMATASFRGTAPSHTQVLWNGMSINSPMLGMVDFSLIPVYFMDDLTLKHGVASTEDISGALGGSISMNNKPDWSNTLSGNVVTGGGSFSTMEDFAQINVGTSSFQSKTRAYYTYSKNDFPFLNNGVGDIDPVTGAVQYTRQRNEHASYRMYSVMQELYGKVTDRDILSLNGWTHISNRSLPRLNTFEGADNANINELKDRSYRFIASWDHLYARGSITAGAGGNIQHLDYYLRNYVNGQGMIPAVYSVSQAVSLINHVQWMHDLSAKSSFRVRVNFNHHDVMSADSVKKTGYDKARDEILFYAGYYQQLGDRVNVRLSVRQDHVDDRFIPIIPSAGIDIKLLREHRVYLKAGITRNYHVPTLNDLYWQPGGNPSLRPEQGLQEEVTLAWAQGVRRLVVETQLTGYHADITDWILWVPTFRQNWEPHNVKRVISKGLEVVIKVKGKIGPVDVTINSNYALTRSLNYGDKRIWGDESYGKQLVYIPVHSGNLFASATWKHYTLTYQYNSYSTRFTTTSNDLSERDYLYPYFMSNVYLSRKIERKRFSLEPQVKVYNLLNERYRSVLGRPMPRRHYMVLLIFRFK
ncbi:TonB-dependent receptor plug domain-containing protein [Fulvivirgaceae bacterium PWU5]|uniref:TonB-dependent receptor plug domain-containing protein n=1 Tax=Dawidia cretensis TaxID=2782350 RepID=A0AAP2GPU6_9BACT|nr:TonB-dependent receptor plug domain-containing protein [Dawidia cretensis]MBT1708986.1 TonB-dependent receptor plug domain-containing protein [Dawidia cretensis]